MFINEIKAAIAAETNTEITSWMMQRQFETKEVDGKKMPDTTKPTPWVSHWDDKNRIRISMHEDVMAAIKTRNGELAYKKQVVAANANRPGYIRFVIITPNNVEAVF